MAIQGPSSSGFDRKQFTETLPHIYDNFMTSVARWLYPPRSMKRISGSFVIEPVRLEQRVIDARAEWLHQRISKHAKR